jgi:hypothetical protein
MGNEELYLKMYNCSGEGGLKLAKRIQYKKYAVLLMEKTYITVHSTCHLLTGYSTLSRQTQYLGWT